MHMIAWLPLFFLLLLAHIASRNRLFSSCFFSHISRWIIRTLFCHPPVCLSWFFISLPALVFSVSNRNSSQTQRTTRTHAIPLIRYFIFIPRSPIMLLQIYSSVCWSVLFSLLGRLWLKATSLVQFWGVHPLLLIALHSVVCMPSPSSAPT